MALTNTVQEVVADKPVTFAVTTPAAVEPEAATVAPFLTSHSYPLAGLDVDATQFMVALVAAIVFVADTIGATQEGEASITKSSNAKQ